MALAAGLNAATKALGAPTPAAPKPAARASGGPIASGVPYIVGERGPELVIPSLPGYVLPSYLSQRPASISGAGSSGVGGGSGSGGLSIGVSGPLTIVNNNRQQDVNSALGDLAFGVAGQLRRRGVYQ